MRRKPPNEAARGPTFEPLEQRLMLDALHPANVGGNAAVQMPPAYHVDLDGDGDIDRDDLAIFLGAFETADPGASDLDDDGDCDRDDLAIFLGAFDNELQPV